MTGDGIGCCTIGQPPEEGTLRVEKEEGDAVYDGQALNPEEQAAGVDQINSSPASADLSDEEENSSANDLIGFSTGDFAAMEDESDIF